jgi:hypothetical protein
MTGSDQPHATKGACLCGAVTFSVTLKNQHVDACHCDMCRSWCAGPFMGVACDGGPVFEDDGALGVYRSSEWAERLFCKSCGASLFYRTIEGGYIIAAADAVDLSDAAEFTLQVFIDEKPGYYAFANATKMMTAQECFDAFAAGQDE